MKFARRKNMALLFLLFIAIILMGIGYASIRSVTGEITGKAIGNVQDGVFITDIEYVSDVDANMNTSKVEKFIGTMMKSTVELSKTNLESQITYKVTVYNSSTEEVPFIEVLYGDEFYDNADIIFELSGFTIGQVIGPKETKDIIITFKYNTSTGVIPDNTVLNSYIKFKLDIPNRMVLAQRSNDATSNYLTGNIAKEKIETVKFAKGTKPDTGFITMFDASEKQDESIIGYYTDTDNNGLYELTFISEDIIYANKNAQYLFQYLTNSKEFDFDNFSTFGVNNVYATFEACSQMTTFNLDSLDMSRVTRMDYMFTKCQKLESINLNQWNTSKVTNMRYMFAEDTGLKDLNIKKLDTSNVTTFSYMFKGCSAITEVDIDGWQTSKVTDISGMFNGCSKLVTIEFANIDTSNVLYMSNMFNGCNALKNIDVSNFDTSRVTNMSQMFKGCNSLTSLDVSNFDTSNVTNMTYMFFDLSKISNLDVSNFNTSKVTNMLGIFQQCSSLTKLDLKNWNTDNVTNMQSMFGGCSRITELDFSNFNTNKVTDMRWMFYYCGALETIYVKEFDSATNTGWTTANINSSYVGSGVFGSCSKIVGGNGTTFDANNITITYARIDKEGEPGYFTKKSQAPSEDISTKPYLPTGFTQVEGADLSNGFTVQDSTGNQYVWVEVPHTKTVYPTAGLSIIKFTDDEYTKIETDLHTYASDYRKEGDYYLDEYSSDEATGLTSEQYTKLKKKMLKSIYQNGGFYIGKYETGIEDAPKTSGSANTAPTEVPVIKQNMYPYNNVTCSQAQTLASSMESGGYNTSLMFGVQWDLTLKYLETKGVSQADLKTDSTSWGNYVDNLWNIINEKSNYMKINSEWQKGAYGKKESSYPIVLTTGASNEFCKQGIYDLAGNVSEWTLEKINRSVVNINRGGYFSVPGKDWVAMYHAGSGITQYSDFTGFRVTLY